jgi:hypothetical protein
LKSSEDEVRKASARLYPALNRMSNGDAVPVSDIWSHGASVAAMRAIGGLLIG